MTEADQNLPAADDQQAEPRGEDAVTVGFTINPRWTREVSELRYLAERLLNVGLSLGLLCTGLERAVASDGINEESLERRVAAYEGLAERVYRAVREHPTWWELPDPEGLFGPLIEEQLAVLTCARASIEKRDAEAARQGARLARASAGRALGLGKLLLGRVVDPTREEGLSILEEWGRGGAIVVRVELRDGEVETVDALEADEVRALGDGMIRALDSGQEGLTQSPKARGSSGR